MHTPTSHRARTLAWRGSSAGALLACLLAPARVALAALPAEHAEYSPEIGEVDVIGSPQAPSTADKALGDTVWIADWTFDAPGGGCTDAGWVKYDNHILNDGSNYWTVDNRFAGTCGISKAAVLSKHDLCWARDGYGNYWDYSIVLKYQAPATLAFDALYDSEAGADFVTVETDSLGLSETRLDLCLDPPSSPISSTARMRTTLLELTGTSGGCQHIGPVALTNFGPGTHEVYIRFASNTADSDEDGGYPTALHAALVIDNIVVTGPLAYSENFEGALNLNAQLLNTGNTQHFCAAPWVRLFSHITDNDKCTEDATCAWLGTDPLRPAFLPDMAFAPGRAVVHNWLDDIFVSPWVSLGSVHGATGAILTFRRFGGNPFGQGDITQGWRVRTKAKVDNSDTPAPGDSIDGISTWGHANQFNSLGSFTWVTLAFDMTANFTPTAKELQVSFRNVDFQYLVGSLGPGSFNPGPGPYNDRVRIGRRILTGPAIDVGSDARTQAQDAFSTVQNSITPGQHFSPDGSNRFGTCAFSDAADLGIGNTTSRLITGDSIYLNSVVDARGAGGVASVQFYGAIVAGPHAGKAPAPYTVGGNGFFAVAADSARNSLGAVVANRWCVDLDDTYFRGGDQLDYFWAATDIAGGFTSSPTGLVALPASVGAAEVATDGLREVAYLPVINWDPVYRARIAADAHGDLDPTPAEVANSSQANCLLYFQKSNSARRTGATQRTAFMYTLDRLGYAGHYDVYDVQGYGNTNNQLGGRANVAQCAGYALIIQDDGRSSLVPNVPDGLIWNDNKIDQAGWYRDYLAQGVGGLAGTATVWLLGENTVYQKQSNPLFTNNMGLTSIVNDQAVAVNPEVVGSASFTWASGGVTNFTGDVFTLQGGCPSARFYDGASASGTAVVTHKYRSSTATGPGAIVMNKNTALHWNTVWMGFGWFDIRDSGAPGTPELDLATKILNGVVPPACQQSPTTGVGGDPTTGALPAVTALHPNVPNPFNPVTEIRFDLAARGAVALRVFDVGGRQVRALVNEARPAGRYKVSWDGLDDSGARVASGIYFYRLDAPAFSASRKMVLLK